MKALVLKGIKQVSYEEVPTPECPRDGLLLKIEAVGLCGSDVRNYLHGHHNIKYPVILGHENVGLVVEKGDAAQTQINVGDRVVMFPGVPCGHCRWCMSGLHSLCADMQYLGMQYPGGFAEYMVIPPELLARGLLLKLPDSIASERAAEIELMSSIYAAQENARVAIGETVVIVGAGPAGCLHTEIARLRGAVNIIVADLSEKRLEMARQFSGTCFVNSGEEDLKAKVMELTGGMGADVAIVAAPTAAPHQQCIELLAPRGRLLVFGGLPHDDPWTKLDGNAIHYKELSVIGTYGYGLLGFKKAFDIVTSGRLSASVVTHVLPLAEMERGVELIGRGEAIKVVLKP